MNGRMVATLSFKLAMSANPLAKVLTLKNLKLAPLNGPMSVERRDELTFAS